MVDTMFIVRMFQCVDNMLNLFSICANAINKHRCDRMLWLFVSGLSTCLHDAMRYAVANNTYIRPTSCPPRQTPAQPNIATTWA